MNKVIPIKLEREHSQRNTKIIDWRLSNVCNFNCSFCPDNFKDGTKRPLAYESYIKLIDRLVDTDKHVWFQFTGGEPTLYPKLIDLLQYIKNKKGFTSMISNGSRTIRWWKELADLNVLDRLYLSYHPEQVETPNHIIEVNNLLQQTNTHVSMFVTTQHYKHLFAKAIKDFELILDQADTICSLKPISDESELQPYTPDQLNTIQKNLYVKTNSYKRNILKKIKYLQTVPWYSSNMKLVYDNNTSVINSAQYLVEHGFNKFKGWECDIGKDLLVIEVDEVYRGMCRENGIVGNVNYDQIDWLSKSIICQKENCNCSLDVQEPKRNLNMVDNYSV